MDCWLVILGFNATLTARSHDGGWWCFSWLSHTSTNTTFLSKTTDYFSHLLLQRWEVKIRQKESSPQPGIELTTTWSWVRHAHHWATLAGQSKWKALAEDKINVTQKLKFVIGWVENIVGKEEMRVTRISAFPTMFSNAFSFSVVKSQDYVVDLRS